MTTLLDSPERGNRCPLAAGHDDWEPLPPPAEPAIPLADWLRGEAGWYRTEEWDGAELIADRIEELAAAAAFWRAGSVSGLVASSPRLKRFDPAVQLPERPSDLAELVACEAAGYLLPSRGDAARLVGWWLADLAHECDYLHAETVQELIDGRAALEMAYLDVMGEALDCADLY